MVPNLFGGVNISTTRIIPIHQNKGKSIQQTLFDSTNYAMNPDKTDNKILISSYACDPETVDLEFALSKKEYYDATGRFYKNDIIAYHIRQSFKPGEITPEEANELSYNLAARLLKGKHAYIVATHIDKHHIHSHIIFNSTNLNCDGKFRNHFNSFKTVREIADYICAEHNLSVIQNPGPASVSYNKWSGCKKRLSNREILKSVIDEILSKDRPKSFDCFILKLEEKGYEINRGKYISAKGYNQKKYIRLKSLGDEYTEDYLKSIIAGTKAKSFYNKEKPSMLIDIQKAMAEGKGIGYQKWAKTFNLKQMAKAFAYLQENNLLSYDSFSKTIEEEKEKVAELDNLIKVCEKRLDEINELKKHIINYSKNNSVYLEYKNQKKSKSFKTEHQAEIDDYMAAKRYFDTLNLVKKLPTVKELNAEFADVLEKKRKAYNELLPLKREYKKHLIYHENVRTILGLDENVNRLERDIISR